MDKIREGMGKAFNEGDLKQFMDAVKDLNDQENIADLFIENGCECLVVCEEKGQKGGCQISDSSSTLITTAYKDII